MPLTENETQSLKSAVYNAGSAIQHLQMRMRDQDSIVVNLSAQLVGLSQLIGNLSERLENLEDRFP